MISQAEATVAAIECIKQLAEALKPFFPDHASGLLHEVTGRRVNENSWHRMSMTLLSLHSVPGRFLIAEEHDARNIGLAMVAVCDKMAASCFGSRDPEWDRDFAVWLAADICGRMGRRDNDNNKDTEQR